MASFRTQDGLTLDATISGSGAPLLLVHGTTSEQSRWQPILHRLNARFQVIALDRRGRGRSGDALPYSFAREFEDIAGVVEQIGGTVNVLGHSYGAIAALEAATRTTNIGRLALYEPPIPTPDATPVNEALADQLDAFILRGDREAALIHFYQTALRAPAAEIEALRNLPNWPARVDLAHTLPREIRSVRAYQFDAPRFAKLTTPVQLLLGTDSPPHFGAAIRLLQDTLPRAVRVDLQGQQHQAINTAPDLFADAVLGFFAGESVAA